MQSEKNDFVELENEEKVLEEKPTDVESLKVEIDEESLKEDNENTFAETETKDEKANLLAMQSLIEEKIPMRKKIEKLPAFIDYCIEFKASKTTYKKLAKIMIDFAEKFSDDEKSKKIILECIKKLLPLLKTK